MKKAMQNPLFYTIKISSIFFAILVLSFMSLGFTVNAMIATATTCIIVLCTITDVKSRTIPNKFVLCLLVIGTIEFILHFILGNSFYVSFTDALLGLVLLPSVLLLITVVFEKLFKSEGIGMGDIKTMGAIGFIIGWKYQFIFIFLSSFLSLMFGFFISIKNKNFKHTMPVAPFMLTSLLLVFFIISIMQ